MVWGRVSAIAAAIAMVMFAAGQARADDPDFLSVAGGWYDWNRQFDQAGEFRLEYRSDRKLWVFKPFAAFAITSDRSIFLHSGLLLDIYFGRRLVLTWSEAPGFYDQGDSRRDLGYPLEFRSQLELSYRFDDRSRLGLAVSHYSNASLGDSNPGTESAMLYYSIPVDKLWWR